MKSIMIPGGSAFGGRLRVLSELDGLLMAAYRCVRLCHATGDEDASQLAYTTFWRARSQRLHVQDWFRSLGLEVTIHDTDDLCLEVTKEGYRFSVVFRGEDIELVPAGEVARL